jgi:hypothetical protein
MEDLAMLCLQRAVVTANDDIMLTRQLILFIEAAQKAIK